MEHADHRCRRRGHQRVPYRPDLPPIYQNHHARCVWQCGDDDASLTAIDAGAVPDPAFDSIVGFTDHQLNIELGPFFTQTFADYNPTNLAKGIYRPVGSTEQEMVSNAHSPVPAPNGLEDLAADAVRSVPNSIIAQTLATAGGNPANLPSYDFTPFQAAAVATGLLRSELEAGVPLSFADIYNVLPLGISPDSSQALPVGYPLISTYLDPADVKKVCALQLVVQTNLAASDFYLNLSGLRYTLKSTESYVYFKYATAAGVLQVTGQKAARAPLPSRPWVLFRALPPTAVRPCLR